MERKLIFSFLDHIHIDMKIYLSHKCFFKSDLFPDTLIEKSKELRKEKGKSCLPLPFLKEKNDSICFLEYKKNVFILMIRKN